MHRATFRPKSSTVCWQRLLRDRYADEGAPTGVDVTLSASRVLPISRALAEHVILKYEWLGTMGAGTQRCYGIFFGAHCGGVTTFASSGAIPAIPKMFALPSRAVSYLARGACTHWAPPGTNSRLIARSCLFEATHGVQLVAAFADTDAGEIGTIYQACNWAYVGRAASGWPQWVSPLGRVWSSNSLTKRRSQQGGSCKQIEARLRAAGWHEQASNPKHRYVYQTDRDVALRARVAALSKPYPKRGRGADIGTAIPIAGGGENPTRPLQSAAVLV